MEKGNHIMSTYVVAADEFARSVKEFLQHVDLLSQACNSYLQAMAASAELRAALDTGDGNLRAQMAELQQAVSGLFGKAFPGESKLEELKAEVMKASAARAGAATTSSVKVLP
jgi:hypothetical protein